MAESAVQPQPAATPPPEPTTEQAAATMRSRSFVVLLIIAAIVGVIVSFVSWGFLQLIYQIQQELYTHLPHALGYPHGPPIWWSLPVLAIGALIAALAITLLPGEGGHLPAKGLAAGGGPPLPITLPGVILAGLATIGSGLILGPEAPLIAIGSGVAVLSLKAARREMPPQVLVVIGAAGSFAAISLMFESPLIAAVILIEAAGIGGARLPLVVLPGLLAAGIGGLISIGMASWTGLNTSHYALGPVTVPHFAHPSFGQFAWTIALAIAIAIVARVIMRGGLLTHGIVSRRLLLLLPIVGLIVAGLAIAFHQATGRSVNEVLFDGQAALPGLVGQAGGWSISALVLLIVFKGLGYGLSLGSFRGGPTFPAVFLGAAAGVLASRLPGFALTPGIAVGIGVGVVAILKLPLSAVVLATLLTNSGGLGAEPLIIVGVVVGYVVTLVVDPLLAGDARRAGRAAAPRT